MEVCLFLTLFGIVYSTESRLGSYNVDSSAVSVSGISSGGAMAAQYHVAHSRDIMGVGIIAGAMWGAGGGNLATSTSVMFSPNLISLSLLEWQAATAAMLGNIDSTYHMKSDRVYVFDGSLDVIVNPAMGRQIETFYKHYVRSTSQIKMVLYNNAQHSMPTRNYGGPCNKLNIPTYLNNCGYDAAYELLNHIYGGGLRKPDTNTRAGGHLAKFDQSEFFTASPITYSMDTVGYVYIPTGCADRQTRCKLHVAFHGCAMGQSAIDDVYVRHGGYNEVAELNNIIILYPQVVAAPPLNVNGCWDWFGYTGIYYATNKGFQIEGVRRMIARVIGSGNHLIG
ncbi:uncharacterized protein LOC121385275 isoform X2 [Gigantopelta aegis]|uniref:uncharacterized protein LOC121385275 isoform X2 n=1 Tax=Gigantopelta aegis TaxID=1735272 RepID=UPI001B88BBF6|nr:uncharacterized protein LOC121385275 isoform X2 [Gigantopelta aegis]